MSSVSQSAMGTVAPHSVDINIDGVQASAYARTVLVGTNVNPAAFREALRCCQVALDEKTEEVQALRAELSNLKASLISDTNQGRRSGRKKTRGGGDLTGTSLEAVKDRINKDVRALAVMHFLWISGNSFQQAPLFSNPFPSASARYFSDENTDLYHTYILYSELPQDYHASLAGSALLKDTFQYLLVSERSTLVRNIRNVAKDIFFGCPPIVAESVALREQTRARERECLRFLVPSSQVPFSSLGPDDPKPLFKYLELPPILFPDLDTSRVQEIFRSDILIQVARCILFGERAPGRVVAHQQGQIERVTISPNCLARQRKINKVSPGLIAAAAILASFVVSGDPAFSERGSETSAAYRSRYFKYKGLLEESQADNHTKATFAYWNHQLFGDGGSSGEFFNFDDDARDEDEMEMHRRAICQSQTPPVSTPPTSISSTQAYTRSERAPMPSLSNFSTRPVVSSNTVINLPPHPRATMATPQPTTSSQPGPRTSSSRSGTPAFVAPPHPSIMAAYSVPISASQPASIHSVIENEDDDGDTDSASDTDITPPASASPVPVESAPQPNNDRELIQQFHTHMNLVDTQPSIPSGVIMTPGISEDGRSDSAAEAQVIRRRQPASRMSRSTQRGAGPKSSSSQTVVAAPTEIRSRLRNRTNALGRS